MPCDSNFEVDFEIEMAHSLPMKLSLSAVDCSRCKLSLHRENTILFSKHQRQSNRKTY